MTEWPQNIKTKFILINQNQTSLVGQCRVLQLRCGVRCHCQRAPAKTILHKVLVVFAGKSGKNKRSTRNPFRNLLDISGTNTKTLSPALLEYYNRKLYRCEYIIYIIHTRAKFKIDEVPWDFTFRRCSMKDDQRMVKLHHLQQRLALQKTDDLGIVTSITLLCLTATVRMCPGKDMKKNMNIKCRSKEQQTLDKVLKHVLIEHSGVGTSNGTSWFRSNGKPENFPKIQAAINFNIFQLYSTINPPNLLLQSQTSHGSAWTDDLNVGVAPPNAWMPLERLLVPYSERFAKQDEQALFFPYMRMMYIVAQNLW